MNKICTRCKQEKDLSCFSYRLKAENTYKSHCKECLKKQRLIRLDYWKQKAKDNYKKRKAHFLEYSKNHYRNNKEKAREYRNGRRSIINEQRRRRYANDPKYSERQRVYDLKYRERKIETKRIWREKNREKMREIDRNWRINARKGRPHFKVMENLRNRIKNAVKNKSDSTKQLMGCSINFFVAYLAARFYGGMTWENYGKLWHIDHIKPCCSFDLTKEENQKECFNWKNCRPLLAKDNLHKLKYDKKISIFKKTV